MEKLPAMLATSRHRMRIYSSRRGPDEGQCGHSAYGRATPSRRRDKRWSDGYGVAFDPANSFDDRHGCNLCEAARCESGRQSRASAHGRVAKCAVLSCRHERLSCASRFSVTRNRERDATTGCDGEPWRYSRINCPFHLDLGGLPRSRGRDHPMNAPLKAVEDSHRCSGALRAVHAAVTGS